ncbi:hypothetical protein MRX96_016997 [Rhipicephalus microplus]
MEVEREHDTKHAKFTEATKKDNADKVRQANETLRQENADLRTTINNLKKAIAEIRKLLLSNNEPPQRPMPYTSKTEEMITNSQEKVLEEPVLKKRAFEVKRKKTKRTQRQGSKQKSKRDSPKSKS